MCPGSSEPFHIVTYYMKWVTTSWTYSIRYIFLHSWYLQSWHIFPQCAPRVSRAVSTTRQRGIGTPTIRTAPPQEKAYIIKQIQITLREIEHFVAV